MAVLEGLMEQKKIVVGKVADLLPRMEKQGVNDYIQHFLIFRLCFDAKDVHGMLLERVVSK